MFRGVDGIIRMNRTASEVAKMFDANSALVKRWASLFSEYLSRGANPPKGTVRAFSDNDVLALCYVWHEWEDEPDIESIKIGLNLGNHFETPFVEHLYLHTPLLQAPPDELDESWRHGILLCGSGRYEYLELARNYRHVAESMLEQALNRDAMDGWAYPVLFAYRHTLELYLKIIGEIDEVTHSLQRCVHLVEKRRGENFSTTIRRWILELEEIDPAGTAFRYADSPLSSNPYAEHWFDFLHFKFAMKRVFDVLDFAILRTRAQGRPAKKKVRKAGEPPDSGGQDPR